MSGNRGFMVMAGPCAVEEHSFMEIVDRLLERGIVRIRGNIYKPRTRSDSFQGLGPGGLPLLDQAREKGASIVSEAVSQDQAGILLEHADMIQVGARNMYNYPLLAHLGGLGVPVVLKRAPSATLDELEGALSYLGDADVILCERGIRGFDTATRYTLDLASAVLLGKRTGLQVIADPSHATGRRDLVAPMALAAMAAGLDGVMLEVHTDPDSSVSDRDQTVDMETLDDILAGLDRMATALDIPFPGV